MTSPASKPYVQKGVNVLTTSRSFESIMDSHTYIIERLHSELRVYRLVHACFVGLLLLCTAAVWGVIMFSGT